MKATVVISTILAALIFAWYLVADRITPYTSNVRVKAMVIDIVPEVSGQVAAVAVNNGQVVGRGDLLARIDPRPFQLKVNRARAALDLATQSVGAGSSAIEVAAAGEPSPMTDAAHRRRLFEAVLAKERRWVRYLSDSSYWMYLAHLPLILVGQALLLTVEMSPIVKTLVLTNGSALVLLVTYALFIRYTPIGTLLNGKRTRPGKAVVADEVVPAG